MNYEKLENSAFNQFNDNNINIVIRYVFEGKNYDIGLINSSMKSESEIEEWFIENYKSRPVKMIGYIIK